MFYRQNKNSSIFYFALCSETSRRKKIGLQQGRDINNHCACFSSTWARRNKEDLAPVHHDGGGQWLALRAALRFCYGACVRMVGYVVAPNGAVCNGGNNGRASWLCLSCWESVPQCPVPSWSQFLPETWRWPRLLERFTVCRCDNVCCGGGRRPPARPPLP